MSWISKLTSTAKVTVAGSETTWLPIDRLPTSTESESDLVLATLRFGSALRSLRSGSSETARVDRLAAVLDDSMLTETEEFTEAADVQPELDAIASLVIALSSTPTAVVQLGHLLLVKLNDQLLVRQLTPNQLADLENSPGLLADPASLYERLQSMAAVDVVEREPAEPRQSQAMAPRTPARKPASALGRTTRASASGRSAVVEVAPVREELASIREDEILVHNSRDPEGPILAFTKQEWTAFVAGVKAGEFDGIV